MRVPKQQPAVKRVHTGKAVSDGVKPSIYFPDLGDLIDIFLRGRSLPLA